VFCAFIKAEITMATIPRRPAMRRDNSAIRRMLKTATGHATRVKADPHSIDSEGRYRAKPITLPTTPYNWRDPDADKR
jgi:hypothetical protein